MLQFALLASTMLSLLAPAQPPALEWQAAVANARQALANRDYVEASARFRSALEKAGAIGEDAGVLEALRGCAASERLQGHLEPARELLARAVSVAEKLHGDPSLEVASTLSELAAVERSRGARQEALAALQSAVRIRELHPEADAEDLARDLTSMALLQLSLEDAKSAGATLRRALAAWDAIIAPDSPKVLPVLDALGGLQRDHAEYADAEGTFLRALQVREAALGPDSPELLSTLDSLAYVYFGQKKYMEAESAYKRLLSLWESSAGPRHPMVALTLDKMAEFYAFQQRYAEAEKAASAALTLRGEAHLASLNQIGRVLLMEAKLAEAVDLYQHAIEIGDLVKASDESLDPLLRIYAKVLAELDRSAEAEAVNRRVKEALLRKADREGRRPSPVKLPPTR